MDRQKKSYILLAVGVAVLVFVIFQVTIPGMRRVSNQEKAHEKEHARMEKQVKEEILEQPEVTTSGTSTTGVNGTTGLTATTMPLRTSPPANPFRYISPEEVSSPPSTSRVNVTERNDVPDWIRDYNRLPSGDSNGGREVRPAEPPEPELPILKGTAMGERKLAVLHFEGGPIYAAVGDKIGGFWEVVTINKDSVTLKKKSGSLVRIDMKGD